MSVPGHKEYNITLSKQFATHLDSSSAAARQPGFTIRYTVPPDSLQTDKNTLDLRKTARGEYIVEGSAKPADGANGAAGPAPAASFRGHGTQTRDTECVLIYNPQTKQYELNLLGMDIQVSPVLKARLRSSGHATANGAASPDTQGILRESSAASRPTSKTPSPVKNTPPPVLLPSQRPSSAALAPRRNTKARLPTRKKITPKPHMNKWKSDADADADSNPSSRAPTPDVATPRVSAVASRVPSLEPAETRTDAVPQHNGSQAPPPLARGVKNPIADPREPPARRGEQRERRPREKQPREPRNREEQPKPQRSEPAAAPVAPETAKTPQAPEAPSKAQTADQPGQQPNIGFEESFNDLADELADELGDDDDDADTSVTTPRYASTWSTGTAGSVPDEDDISSEEE